MYSVLFALKGRESTIMKRLLLLHTYTHMHYKVYHKTMCDCIKQCVIASEISINCLYVIGEYSKSKQHQLIILVNLFRLIVALC